MSERRHVYEDERRGDTYSYRAVVVTEDGGLRIEGQDLGALPEEVFGRSEYEFTWTLDAPAVMGLRRALALAHDDDLLDAVAARFATTHDLEQFIVANGIAHDVVSW
jgi:hypothetical protein